MEDQLVDTWNIHCRINLYLLDAIPAEALEGTAGGKGRSAGAMFAHIHNARLMWLEVAEPELMEGLAKIAKEQAGDRALLRQSLEASGSAIAALLKKGFAPGGKIKGFKPHTAAFLGYLISHESYHRGEIGIILAQSGHRLEDKISYGMWEWGTR